MSFSGGTSFGAGAARNRKIPFDNKTAKKLNPAQKVSFGLCTKQQRIGAADQSIG